MPDSPDNWMLKIHGDKNSVADIKMGGAMESTLIPVDTSIPITVYFRVYKNKYYYEEMPVMISKPYRTKEEAMAAEYDGEWKLLEITV